MSGRVMRFAMALMIFGAGLASAQGTKSARGTVTAMSGDTITIKAGEQELKLTIDQKTVLTAKGAGTAERKADAAGKPGGTKLADFVKVGDAVEVSYHEAGMHAANITRVASAGSGGGSVSGDRAESSNGTVDSVSATTLVISGKTGSGSFKQSFAVDGTTKVIAAGASTAANAAGGKVQLGDFVGVGDQVTVNYRKAGAGLHADEVRVRVKAPKK